ncbi:MAG: hypothetical protein KGN31_06270 [Betaproteobacteria bacterium]|nr:hypothetical protein [Betaproteobacteria bacterium]
MSIREEVWQAFLGRPLNEKETQDQIHLRNTLRLYDDDPFWGVIAFFYHYTAPIKNNPLEIIDQLKQYLAAFEERQLRQMIQLIQSHSSTAEKLNSSSRAQSIQLSQFIIGCIVLGVVVLLSIFISSEYIASSLEKPTHVNQPSLLEQWGKINPQAKKALLSCQFSSKSRLLEHQHRHICYPAGDGIGYYVD